MEMKCSKCGGDLVMGVMLNQSTLYGVIFVPMEDINKIRKRKSVVICDACTKCGCIENIRVEDPEEIQ